VTLIFAYILISQPYKNNAGTSQVDAVILPFVVDLPGGVQVLQGTADLLVAEHAHWNVLAQVVV
jgi:hypothetical protein